MDNAINNSFVTDDLPENVEIIGISFRGASKIYYFNANGNLAKEGDNAIVETARGLEYGKVALTNTLLKRESLVLPLKNVIRIADKNDDLRFEANREKEKDAFEVCQKKIADHKLDMKLIDVEYTFDNSKLLFYFTSDDRVDFRELVKDLAGYFRTRIELRQIGIRDEAKIMGGLGICGRPFCCSTFLPDFVQVSIKMAKEQNLSLNSAKISGACGRLMCCLRYEYDTYQEELRRMPKVDTQLITPDGVGTVIEIKPLENIVKVRLLDENEKQPKLYHLSVLKPYDKKTAEEEEARRLAEKTASEVEKEKGERRNDRGERKKNENERRKERAVMNDKKAANEKIDEKTEKKPSDENGEADKSHPSEGGKKRSRSRHRHGRGHGTSEGHGEGALNTDKNAAGGDKPHTPNENRAASTVVASHEKNGAHEKKENASHPTNKGKNLHTERAHDGKASEPSSHEKGATATPKPAQTPSNGGNPSAAKEENGRKSYAPLPSNSVKKSGRGRMNTTIRTKPTAFGERKDNSEKK